MDFVASLCFLHRDISRLVFGTLTRGCCGLVPVNRDARVTSRLARRVSSRELRCLEALRLAG